MNAFSLAESDVPNTEETVLAYSMVRAPFASYLGFGCLVSHDGQTGFSEPEMTWVHP